MLCVCIMYARESTSHVPRFVTWCLTTRRHDKGHPHVCLLMYLYCMCGLTSEVAVLFAVSVSEGDQLPEQQGVLEYSLHRLYKVGLQGGWVLLGGVPCIQKFLEGLIRLSWEKHTEWIWTSGLQSLCFTVELFLLSLVCPYVQLLRWCVATLYQQTEDERELSKYTSVQNHGAITCLQQGVV